MFAVYGLQFDIVRLTVYNQIYVDTRVTFYEKKL